MELHGAFLFLLVALLIKGSKCIFDEEGPSFLEEPPSKLEFINEKGLQLNCTARGRPKPMITWATNDGNALFDVPGLRYVSTNGALIFNPFTAESFRPDVHSATYRCIASNSFGTVVSRDVRLRAVVKQSFEPEVHNVRAIKDFPVILQCVLPNFLRDFVTVTSWIYGSLNILPSSGFESEKYLMLDHGQLLIWQVSLQDSYSSYQCRTFHRFTEQVSVSAPAKLIVTEATEPNRPVIQHKASSNVIVKENDRVVLPCIAYGHPRPSHKWLKREGSRLTPVIDDLSEDMRLSSRHTIDGNSVLIRHGALVFNSVRVPNKGTYLCNVTNPHGSDFVEIHLTVRSSLVVNLQPEKSTVDLGKNVELNCYASGEPPPTVQWMKDGRLLRPGNTAGRIRFIGQTRIQVVGVQREDQGVYQCMARNDYETIQRSAQVWLGDSPPKFLYRFIEQSLQPGPAISLKCSASGNPTPQISWLLDGFELPKSDRFLMGQYANVYGDVISHVNITSVQVEDGGQYECIATNRAGKEVHTAALNIYGAPFARSISDITAVAGKRFQFKCPVGGYPIETISFEKDGLKLPSGRRQEVRDGSLLIESMERSDEGTYTCKAENKQGQSSQTSVKVRVIVPPKITPFSFPPWVRVNERTGIQCIISIGDPPFELTWIKDTVPLHSNTFTSMSTGDSSRKNTEISVPAPPSLLSSTHPKTNKNNNQQHESNNLNSIQHQKQQLLSWRDSNEAENPSTKIIIGHSEFSSYLNIPSITVEHMGNYTCLTKSLISGETASYTAQLTVNAAIKISKFTFEDGLIADRGMRTQVMCAATEGEPDKITWLRDNVELKSSLSVDDNNSHSLFTKLPSSSSSSPQQHPPHPQSPLTPLLSSSPHHPPGISIHRFGAFSSILTIVNVSSVHSANYKCILANRFGQTSHQASLIVRVPPKFTVEPQDQQITVGTQVLIDCQAEGTPMPRINWKQVVGPVEKKEYREVGYRTPGVLAAENGTLIISRATEDHAGYYSCIASQPSSTSSSTGLAHQQQQHQHADMQTEISKLIHLLVNVPPRIKARPPKEIVRRQETAILKCEVTGDEPLRISWFAKGVRLVDNVETRYSLIVGNKSSELTIQDVSSEDSGDFECVATNAYGQDQIWISLLVQERPQVPRNLHVSEKTSRSLVLTWSMAINQESPVLNYMLSYKEESENWEEHRTRKKSIAGDHNSVAVKNLQPATNYEFRLFARNSQGLSDSSEILKVRTESEPPSGPPMDIIVEPVSSTELRIRWKPPRLEDWNGQILGYNIRYRNNREDLGAFNWTRVEKISTDPTLPLTKSIGNLEKYEEYQLTIQAFNEKGPGAYSDPVTALTLEDVPSSPPSSIHCSPLTPHSLQINWQPPPRNSIHGNLQGFRVFVEQLPQQIGGDHPNYSLGEFESKVPSGSLSTIMHNFVPFTNYSIQVAAYTRVGEGVQSKAVFCQTKESVPSEPSAIKAIVSSTESVIVSWLPPKIPNGLVVKFNVYTRISGERREIRTMKRNLPSHVLHYEVTDLKRYESYEAWVTAETSAGEGQSTASVPLQGSLTPNNIPAAVVSIGSIVVTAWKTNVILQCQHVGTAVTLQWYKRDVRLTESSRVKLLTSGSLSIENVERADSGNISCVVKNPHGTDSVTYVVKVQVVPSSPLLHTTAVSNSSVRLQWKQGDNGGTPILGFTLIYKQEAGEWEEITLNRRLSNYELKNLACGTAFEFFLTGFNKIGSSEPSETLYVRTKGSRPVLPPVEDFLQSDSTSIRLNFSEWENVSGDCPVTSFTVEYKTEGKNWVLVKTDKSFVEINHLSPEMEYKLRVTAYNGAGSSSGEFAVSTSLFKGGLISSNLNPQVPFYLDVYIIVPIVASVASIIIAAAGVILCWKKKNFSSSGMNLTPKTNLGLADSERDYTVIRAKFMPDCDRYPESADDIYPYATFQLAEPEKTNLAGNIPDSHVYGPRPTSNMDPGLLRGIYRGTLPGHGTAKRRKSRSKTRSDSHKMGESDEYDSIHSDSDGDEPIANSIETIRGNRRYSARNNTHFPSNDVTMVVTDRDRGRKSLPRRPKVPILNGGEVMIPDFLDETSFIYTRDNHVPTDFVSHYHPGPTELISQLNCDMDLKRGGRRKAESMFVPLPPTVGGGLHPEKELNQKGHKKPRDPRDLELYRHQDYTIAV